MSSYERKSIPQEEGKSHNLVTYESGPKRTHVYCLVNRDLWKIVKDIKILPREERITHHWPLPYDFEIKKVKDTREKFAAMRKV